MAEPRQAMTVYLRGRRHMLTSIAGAVLIIWGIPFAAALIGIPSSSALPWVILPLAVVWVLFSGFGSFLIACPQCNRSVFMRGLLWTVPWPARRCSKCGNDLTLPIQSE
ncbi:MAG: hypothetical protein J7493_06165 [Porphyrobacter sp.]|nr:hypothetical protein [Porphyrobacter sp.]